MRERKVIPLLLLMAFAVSLAAFGQVKTKAGRRGLRAATASSGVEPLRVINGEMQGRIVAGSLKVNNRPSSFSFTLSKVEIADGQVQLSGSFVLGSNARRAEQVKARVAGTMAKATNPWPGADDQEPEPEPETDEQGQGREAKNPETSAQLGELSQSTQDTAHTTPAPKGGRNEQTQSLYSQAEDTTGCGLVFLSLTLPAQMRTAIRASRGPVQLGVVLAPIDNRMGEEINRSLCHIIRAGGNDSGKEDVTAAVERLNHMLESSR